MTGSGRRGDPGCFHTNLSTFHKSLNPSKHKSLNPSRCSQSKSPYLQRVRGGFHKSLNLSQTSQPFTNLLTLRSTNLLTLRAVLRANPPTCKEFEVVFTNLSTFHKSLNHLISKILSINDLQTRKTVVSVTIEKT